MGDNLSVRAPQDKNRISMKEPWEVQYWTKALGCTKEELQKAVDTVGNSTTAVKQHLGKS